MECNCEKRPGEKVEGVGCMLDCKKLRVLKGFNKTHKTECFPVSISRAAVPFRSTCSSLSSMDYTNIFPSHLYATRVTRLNKRIKIAENK